MDLRSYDDLTAVLLCGLDQIPMGRFFSVFHKCFDHCHGLLMRQSNPLFSQLSADDAGEKAIDHQTGGEEKYRFVIQHDFHSPLFHEDMYRVAVRTFYLDQVADRALLDQLKDLGEIDIFERVVNRNLREIYAAVDSDLHQSERKIDAHVVTVGGRDTDAKHHILDVLSLIFG